MVKAHFSSHSRLQDPKSGSTVAVNQEINSRVQSFLFVGKMHPPPDSAGLGYRLEGLGCFGGTGGVETATFRRNSSISLLGGRPNLGLD